MCVIDASFHFHLLDTILQCKTLLKHACQILKDSQQMSDLFSDSNATEMTHMF